MVVRQSPQFDICYALADLTSPDPLLRKNLFGLREGSRLLKDAQSLGWGRWLAVPHIVAHLQPAKTCEQFVERLRKSHPDTAVVRLSEALRHRTRSKTAGRRKLEWLHYVGLGPADEAENSLPPDRWLELIVSTLSEFSDAFAKVWSDRLAQREALAERALIVAKSRSLSHVIHAFDLPIETILNRRKIKALRGGFQLDVNAIGTVWLIPSLFNTRRVWNAVDKTLPATILLPIGEVDPKDISQESRSRLPSVDPWLVCRALGDPTRAELLRMLSWRTMSAAELGSALGLSKATVSHHLFQLREARLIVGCRDGRSMQLRLRMETIASVSRALLKDLKPR